MSTAKKYKVLLVDDSQTDYYLAEQYMSAYDACQFEIDWVDNYDEAINKALSHDYDFCMLDYHLGGYNGVDLAKAISNFGARSPVFLYSGVDAEKVEGLDDVSNIVGFISKLNLSTESIIRELRQVIRDKAKKTSALADREIVLRANYDSLRNPLVAFDEEGRLVLANDAFANFGFSDDENYADLCAATIFDCPDFKAMRQMFSQEHNVFVTSLKINGHEHHRIVWNLIPVQLSDNPEIRYVAKGVLQKRKWKKHIRKPNKFLEILSRIYKNPSYVNINDNYINRDLYM